jgi:peptidoglycan/xylan/chitin deacetylase (PgdA/CDA1 family)
LKHPVAATVGKAVSFLVLVCLAAACGNNGSEKHRAGIALSFDDHFITEWYELRPLFQKYNAKVTFFITCPDSLTAGEVFQLKQLEKDGHEIGFHSTRHGKSTEIIAAIGPEGYYKSEIEPGMKYMLAAGFKPTSYAHPGGNHNEQVDSVLFANGFKIIRDVAISKRKLFGFQIYALAPRLMQWIFYPFRKQKSVDALLIDTDSDLTETAMIEAVQKARISNTALMLFGHEPLYKAPENGEYGFSVAFLEKILSEAKKQNLYFYKMSELPAQ